MTTNHEKFLAHLSDSQAAVWRVAMWLQKSGYSVTVSPLKYAKNRDEWKECVDDGDIYINQRVEVKRLGVNFSSEHDWPYHEKFIVCSKNSYDRAVPKPFAYICLSSDMGHVAIAMAKDSESWYVETKSDGRYENVSQEFYLSPLCKVKFMELK